MPRSGKRLGAGAPKGNCNAIKYGRYSRGAKKLVEIFASDPEARLLLIGLKQAQDRQTRKARRLARKLFYDLLNAMPVQPDTEFNQTVKLLIRKLQATIRIQDDCE